MKDTTRFRASMTAGLLAVALAVAGCGGSSSHSSSNGSTSPGSASDSSQTANSNKLAQFSQCMRAKGVPDFPDPVNGHLSVKVTKGSDLDPSSPAYQSALQSCKSLEPASMQSGTPQSTQNQNKVLKFVDCMRSHGVPNFPSPNAQGGVLIQGGQINPNSPQFQSAMQACRSLLPPGAVGG